MGTIALIDTRFGFQPQKIHGWDIGYW